MNVRLILAIAVAPLLSDVAGAAQFATPEAARKATDAAMALIVKDDVAGAFGLLRTYAPLPANEFDVLVQTTIQQRNVVAPRFGKSLGYVFLKEERVSDFLIRYTYVEKRETHALRWRILLYKPNKEWIINAITWDDRLPELVGP